ncbi:MAG TPA: hypothetical protein DF364_02745 [Ruminococcaceae bacterium]|nr:hypothetical protein [Oscillospiraceae bacterium]
MKNRKMFKGIALLLAAVMVFALTGCETSSTHTSSITVTTSVTDENGNTTTNTMTSVTDADGNTTTTNTTTESDGDIAQMQLVDQDTIIADMIACMREFR